MDQSPISNHQSPISSSPILVLGLTAAGAAGLPEALCARVHAAEVLAGGRRQLGYFSAFAGERVVISGDVAPLVARLQQARERGERAVVLASGDPLWYGVGASLRRAFPAEALEMIPAPTAFQLAFAALGEPWHDAALLSAHARPLPAVVAALRTAMVAAILTDNEHTPAAIARALLADGHAPETRCAVCENLGGAAQRIVRASLGAAAQREHAALNVFVVWGQGTGNRGQGTGDRETGRQGDDISPAHPLTRSPAHPAHPPDEAYATSAGQITKREVRMHSLAALALASGEVLWDIGAGSGAVSIEAARAQPAAQVFAVEQRAAFVAHIGENLRRFPAPNVTVIEGSAPDACAALPAPHAVFIGGSGGRLAEIVALVRERLQCGGRLVVNVVTLENLAELRALLPDAQIVQIQISRGVPIQTMLRFEALNPVFVVTWTHW